MYETDTSTLYGTQDRSAIEAKLKADLTPARLVFEDGQFLGLPLDQENQANRSEERIRLWVEQVLREATSS